MKNIISSSKRLLAITTAFVMLFGACFTSALNVSADTALTDGLTHVATTADNAKPFGNDYWVKETDITGGGVALHWDMYSAWSNFFYDETLGTDKYGTGTVCGFPGKYGFSLHFDGYTKTAHTSNKGDGIIAITFTHTPGFNRIITDTPFIMIDTNEGTLSIAHGTSDSGAASAYTVDAVVITNGLLKYDSIKSVPFVIEFSRYSDTKTQVSVNVNGTYVTGLMETALVSGLKRGPNAANHYIFANIGGLEMNDAAKVPFELNFYGHKLFDENYIAPSLSLSGLAAGLTHAATVENNQKPFGNDWWATETNITGGGVALEWTMYSAWSNYFYNQTLGTAQTGAFPGTYGFSLHFDGYSKTADTLNYGDGIIAISFTHTPGYTISTGVPFIMLDTNDGTLSVAHGLADQASQYEIDALIIDDDMLSYENIKDIPFIIEFSRYSNTKTQVTVRIDDVSVTGLMETALITNGQKGPNPANHYIFAGIGGIEFNDYARVGFKLNFYGHKLLDETYKAPEIATSGSDDLLTHVATTADNTKPFGNDWWAQENNITDGGVALKWTMYSAWSNFFYDEVLGTAQTGAFPGKRGFSLHFGGYKKTTETENYGDGIIAISFTHTSGYTISSGVPFIMLNTNEGTLSVAHGTADYASAYETDALVIENDILKYNSIKEVPFVLEFTRYSDTKTKITVSVNGTEASGLMDTALITNGQKGPNAANHYIFAGIGGIEFNDSARVPFELCFYGHKLYDTKLHEDVIIKAQNVAEVISAIDALDDTVSISSSNEILLAKAKYDTLKRYNKAKVTNADKLNKLISELNTLRNNTKYKPTSTYIAITPEPYEELGYHPFGHPDARTVFSKETSNGFRVDFNGADYNVTGYRVLSTQSVYGAFSLDGLSLFIDDFNFKSSSKSDFYLGFTSGDYTDYWDGSPETSERMIAIHLGNSNSGLEINGVGLDDAWSAGESTLIPRENLSDKQLIVEWNKQSNGDYVCSLTIGEQVVAFTVSADKLAAMSGFDQNKVRVVLGTYDVKNEFSLEINGIYANLDSTVFSVINQIANLPTSVTNEAEISTIEAVQQAYNALTVAQKEQILNTDHLSLARAAVRKYEGIDVNNRDNDGFYIPNLTDDVTGNVAQNSRFAYVTESNLGGLHYDFNNGGFGLANSLKKHYIIEDITLRFDNFRYSNDNGLLIGFECVPGDCQTYNLSASLTKRAFYLLIGKNNTVYCTKGNATHEEMFPIFDCNELLSSTNLINKEFFVSLKVVEKTYNLIKKYKTIEITFTVDGTSFSYTLTRDQMNLMSIFDFEDVEVVIQTGGGLDPSVNPVQINSVLSGVSIDVTGIKYNEYSKSHQASINNVINQINRLPATPALEIESSVYSVWKQYFNLLSQHLRDGVTNASKLIALRDGIFDLYAKNSKINQHTQGYVGYSDIDNSSLLPQYIPDSEVTLDKNGWPSWTKDLVITEAVCNKIGKGGTLLKEDVEPYLEYLAKTGINCLWLTPVQDMGTDPTQVTYLTYGPHTINPYLTGQIPYGEDWYEVDYDESRRILSEFVDLAHSYNIRIIFDVTDWGVASSAPIYQQHPDWFPAYSSWGGPEADNSNAEVYDYYYDSLFEFVMETKCDGIRWDLEPTEFGYDLAEALHTALNQAGKKILFFSEAENTRGNGGYAFEQDNGVKGEGVSTQLFDSVFFNQTDIVDATKNGNNLNGEGRYKYYAYQMSCHDYIKYRQPSLASWAYEFAFSSFIPLFYTGEERNAYTDSGSCYGAVISDFNEKITDPETREYYESVKKLLQLRWQYKDLVNSTVDNHRNTNICSVRVKGSELVNGYARYAGNQGMLVVPNVNYKNTTAEFTVQVPINDMGLSGYNHFTLTNLLTGEVIASGTKENVEYFSQSIKHNTAGVYLVTGENCSYTATPNAQIDRIEVSVNGNTATLDAFVKADALKQLKNVRLNFNGTNVTDYINDGDYVIFSYTTDSPDDISVVLSGVYKTNSAYSAPAVKVDLERLNSLDGDTFAIYVYSSFGDANDDGKADVKDLVRTKKIVAGLVNDNDNADHDGNGSIVASDLILLAKYIINAKRGVKVNTVTFNDSDGTLIDRIVVPDGFGAKPAITPSKYAFLFNGWSDSTAAITQNKTVTAQYK